LLRLRNRCLQRQNAGEPTGQWAIANRWSRPSQRRPLRFKQQNSTRQPASIDDAAGLHQQRKKRQALAKALVPISVGFSALHIPFALLLVMESWCFSSLELPLRRLFQRASSCSPMWGSPAHPQASPPPPPLPPQEDETASGTCRPTLRPPLPLHPFQCSALFRWPHGLTWGANAAACTPSIQHSYAA
jgi:hypothetical protein